MPKVTRVVDKDDQTVGWNIHCPACNEKHYFDGRWWFNGDLDRPTFSGSMLHRSGHYVPGYKQGARCWCTYNAEHPGQPAPFACSVCHSYVTDGQIQFLADCTHDFAGQTVDLPEID